LYKISVQKYKFSNAILIYNRIIYNDQMTTTKIKQQE